MTTDKTIIYRGTTIDIWDQSIRVGESEMLWFKRPVTKEDILAVKTIIDAGWDALATQLRKLHKEKNILLGIR